MGIIIALSAVMGLCFGLVTFIIVSIMDGVSFGAASGFLTGALFTVSLAAYMAIDASRTNRSYEKLRIKHIPYHVTYEDSFFRLNGVVNRTGRVYLTEGSLILLESASRSESPKREIALSSITHVEKPHDFGHRPNLLIVQDTGEETTFVSSEKLITELLLAVAELWEQANGHLVPEPQMSSSEGICYPLEPAPASIDFGTAASSVTLSLLRRYAPDGPSEWDRDAISTLVSVRTGPFAGKFETIVWSHELETLRHVLVDLHDRGGSSIEREFTFREARLSLTFRLDKRGGMAVEVEVASTVDPGPDLTFTLDVDQTYLPAWAKSIELALATFPVNLATRHDSG